MKTKINKTKNIFEDAIENCTWINPYGAMFSKHNINFFSKLCKHTFTRTFKKSIEINKPCSSVRTIKSVCNDKSPDRGKKDGKGIIPAKGYDRYNYPRYDMISTGYYKQI